ncbi:MAG: cysteine synthase family protein [Nanoarchaeota archaeon]
MLLEDITQGIGNTPLIRINRINPNRQVEIFSKSEANNPTRSIKDRIALAMIDQAEKTGELVKGKVIIEPTSGNTGIGLAMIGAVRGYEVEIVMSEAVSIERRKILSALGAKVILTPGDKGTDGAIVKARELVRQNPGKYFMPDQFSNHANYMAHYRTTAEEIWRDMEGRINYFVSSLGTSGTLMGVSRYLHERDPAIKIVSAHPTKGHYIQGLKNMEEAIVPAIYDPKKIDITIMVESEAAIKMARRIMREEGQIVGMSSGAAMLAAYEVAENHAKPGERIVVIFPDSGERYLSTKLFAE